MIVGLHTRLRPGAEADYDRAHEAVWLDVLAAIRAAGIERWHIFRDGLDLFHFVECADYDAAMARLADDPVNRRWQEHVAPLMDVPHDHSGAGRDRMRLIFAL